MNNNETLRLKDQRVDMLLEKLEIPGVLRNKSEEAIREQFGMTGFTESTGEDVLTHVSVTRTTENTVVEIRMGEHSVYSMRRIVENADAPTDEEVTELENVVAQVDANGYRVPYAPIKQTAPEALLRRAKERVHSLFRKRGER